MQAPSLAVGRMGVEHALVAAGLLAIGVTLALCPYVPFQDLPNHTKVLALDATLQESGGSAFLVPGPRVTFGYSLVVDIARLLGPVVGAAAVVRLLCIASAVGIPLGAMALARATGAPAGWAALLVLPLAVSWPLRVGMLPYALALPFVELGFAAALRTGREGGARAVLLLASSAVAAYLAHPYGFAWLVILACVAIVAPSQRAKGSTLRVAMGLSAAIPLLAYDLLLHRLSMVPGAEATVLKSPMWWRPLPMALGHIVTRGLGVTGPDALIYYEPFLLVLVLASVSEWRRPEAELRRAGWALAAAAFLGTLGTVALPESRENVFLIGSRVTVLGMVFWAGLAAPALARVRWLRAAAVPAIALPLGFQLHEVVARAAVLTEVLGIHGPEQVDGSYLPVQVPRCESASSIAWGDYDPLRHAWAYALGPEGVAPYIFAVTRYQPVWFRLGVLNTELRAPNEHLLTQNERWRPKAACDADAQDRIVAAASWPGTYDAVLVVGRPPEVLDGIERSGLAIERQLSPGVFLVRRGVVGSGLRVEFGKLAGGAALRSGFYGAETVDGRSVQWSQGDSSVLRFALTSVSDDYLLRVRAQSPVVPSISVVVNSTYQATLPMTVTLSESAAYVPGSALRKGENEIRLGYPRTFWPAEEWGSGPARELSVMFNELLLQKLAGGVSLDVGTPGARHRLVQGFSIDEVIDGRTAAWSEGKESVVELDVGGGAPEYALTLRARAVASQEVAVTFNRAWTGTLRVEDTWGDFTLPVPGDAVTHGRNTIRFSYASTVRPVDQGKGDDARDLGVAYDAIALEPFPAELHIDLSAPAARGMLRSGFSQAETIDGRSAVWSDGKSSEIAFALRGDPVAHRLTVQATGRGLQGVTLVWNDSYESTTVVPPTWSDVSVVVPAGAVRPGRNSLRIVYDAPSHPDGDPRLLAVAYQQLAIEPVGANFRVNFGTPSGRRQLHGGWSRDEVIDEHPAVWSLGPWSEIEMPFEPALLAGGPDPGANLEFTVQPFEAVAPQKVEVRVNDRFVGTVVVTSGWRSYRVAVPTDALRSGANIVRWTYARLSRPRDTLPGSTDTRALALAFHDAWLR